MRATIGDRVYVASAHRGRVRCGSIVELRHKDGTPPYVVRWSDTGQESVWFPRDERAAGDIVLVDRPVVGADVVEKDWYVDLHVVESGPVTTVQAVLHEGDHVLTGDGRAVRQAGAADVPEIGDDLAAARALQLLADRLLCAARAMQSGSDVDLSARIDVREPADR